MRRLVRITAGLVAALLAVPVLVGVGAAGGQEADGGALTYGDCITSDTEVTACARIDDAAAEGANTALTTLRSLAVSPDGTSVYTTSHFGAAVSRLDRADDGTLTFRDCITADIEVIGCTPIADAAPDNGENTGLESLWAVVVSPDGTSVYTASFFGDAVATFDRADDGALIYQGCITSDTDVIGCTTTADATQFGSNTGLNGLRSVVVSPDGTSVYTAGSVGDVVGMFARAADGALTYQGCITTNSSATDCTIIPGGTHQGLGQPASVAVSPDNTSVYIASSDSDAVTWFDRADDGMLTYRDCITSNSDVTGCSAINDAAPEGTGTGLDAAESVVVSPDGTSVYAASRLGDAVARFGRMEDGSLRYGGCITSNSDVTGCATTADTAPEGTATGLDSLQSVAVSPDGTSVYTASWGAAAVGRFDRADDGTLTYRDCLTASTSVDGCTAMDGATEFGDGTGMFALQSVVVSPDGRSVYTASGQDDAVARFDRTLPSVPAPAEVVRLEGTNRFGTAAAVALDRFDPAEVDTVFLATGFGFPDALAGGPLAAAESAPILLTTLDALPDETADALEALAPGRVVALGGTAVLSDQVLADAALAAGGADTDRLFGPDRYATAAAIAAEIGASDAVVLATGLAFPDALAGSAATAGAPILLVTPTSLPEPTRQALAARTPGRIIALGGTAAISDQVLADAADTAGGANTGRLFGPDRYATAVDVAGTFDDPATVYVATGLDFPDALAGGPAAVAETAPILLVSTDTVPDVVHTYLDNLPALRRIVILGGTAAITDTVETTLEDLLDP